MQTNNSFDIHTRMHNKYDNNVNGKEGRGPVSEERLLLQCQEMYSKVV